MLSGTDGSLKMQTKKQHFGPDFILLNNPNLRPPPCNAKRCDGRIEKMYYSDHKEGENTMGLKNKRLKLFSAS